MLHLDILIFGVVQNVGFRYHAWRMARDLGLKGYVRNLTNGSVFIEIEGEKKALKTFLDWCYGGPIGAMVSKVDYKYDPKIKRYREFIIR